jgi:TM2 domain-containing membrane protein YozV
MMCVNHGSRESVASCERCGRPLCAECAVSIDASAWCRECLQKAVKRDREHRARRRWRKPVAALLSIVPGAGHMFLGQIGKGFALMGLLFAAVFLVIVYSDSTGMYWMIAYLVPALSVLFLCYAVFDSMSIADGSEAGPSTAGDDTLKRIWERVLMSRRTIGWVVLVAGVVGILNIFSSPLAQLTRVYLSMEIPFAGLVLPVVLLVIGVVLVAKGRKTG